MRLYRGLIVLACLLGTREARAVDYSLRLEPGVAWPINRPLENFFDAGAFVAVKPGVMPVGWLDLHLALQFVALPQKPSGDAGEAWGFGGGVRIMRPHSNDGLLYPWLDGEALYVHTGGLDRPGFSVGAGLAIPGGEERRVWIGPFVRYYQIIDLDSTTRDTTDAKIIIAGISLEIASAHPEAPPPPPEEAAPPAPVDRDGDGVLDDKDHCPAEAGPVENEGCPWPDGDKDGVLDKDDQCPTEAGKAETHGCPDSDGDGVVDKDDQCPGEAGKADTHGCPDRDGDGVADKDDKCPDKAGPADNGGCPPDRDGDGVADADDNCPDKAGPADNGGCPVYKQVTVTKGKIEIKQKIFFANDQSKILKKSFVVLDDVALVLKDNPSLKVRVGGHTDDKGKPEHNLKLSEGRALAVRDYLITKGVAAAALEAKGFGSTQPIADNKTDAGREQNRRVEFVLIGDGAAQ